MDGRQTVLVQAPKRALAASPTSVPGHVAAVTLSHNAPIPPLPSSNHVLVRVLAVALNPTDYKMPTHFPMPGSTMGCDFCGIVVSPAGSTVSSLRPKDASSPGIAYKSARRSLPPPGTRVCGAVYAYNPEDPLTGAFAQYVVADARLLLRVPAHWSDLRAAALGGIGWGTAGLALWQADALSLEGRPTRPLIAAETTPVLVYGGATATGTMACQLLKLSGYSPIAVTSKTSTPLAKAFGAVATVSYTSPTCTQTIKGLLATLPSVLTPSSTVEPPKPLLLRHALDCITDPESAAVCFGSLTRIGGRYACLEAFDEAWRSRRAVRVGVVMAYELWGARVLLDQGDSYCSKGNGAHDDEDKTRCGNIDASGTKGLEGRPSQENMEDTTAKKKMQSAAVYSRPASPEKLQSTIDWADEMQDLLDRGLVNNHPVHELEGKWDGIIRGLGMLQRGEVRGCKLVVRMYET